MSHPLWISHRGFKQNAVENTGEAFRAAVKLGFTALETDLRLSADGHIVLHHDPDLRRLAKDPRELSRLTRAELEGISLGEGGARLCFLDQFLAEFPGLSWVFDVKPETGAGVIRALHKLVVARGFTDWLLAQAKFVTWSRHQEALLRQLFPGAALYAREPACWRAGLALIGHVPSLAGLRADRTYALPPRLGRVSLYTEAFVGAFHRAGAKVIAFLPGTAEEAAAAANAGVDEILTNDRIPKEQ